MLSPGAPAPSDDESTIKVAPKKELKDKLNGTIKLKKPPPKHSKPGNWRDGSVIDGGLYYAVMLHSAADNYSIDEKKTKGTDTPSTNSVDSPGPVVNQLDDAARETFATGRPLEDTPDLQTCKHCKKSILKTAAKAHLVACLKNKREKDQRKKEQKEARKKAKGEAEGLKKEEDDDDDDDDELGPDKKGPGGLKSAKKSASKKVDGESKGKKRKADLSGDAEKGPKQKKKKEEPKAKVPKPRGNVHIFDYLSTLYLR